MSPGSSTASLAGAGLAESVAGIINAVQSRDWVDASLSAVSAGLDAFSLTIDPLGTVASWGFAWLIEHLQPLKAALDQLAGNPAQIQAHVHSWQGVADTLRREHDELSQAVRKTADQWKGNAGDAARRAGTQNVNLLEASAKAAACVAVVVSGGALVVAVTRVLVRDLIAQCLSTLAVRLPSWIAAAGVSLGTATPAIIAQAQALIAQFAKKIGQLLKALTGSLRQLGKHIGDLGSLVQNIRATVRQVKDSAHVVAAEVRTTAAQAGHLLEADLQAISYYTGSGYRRLNKMLRGELDNPFPGEVDELRHSADSVSAALAKIPPHDGVTYRGTPLSDAKLDQYVVGKVTTERAFMSTSTKPDGAFHGNTYFIVNGHSGRDIMPYSLITHEAEVLFDRGTDFLVTSKNWNPEINKWVITLKEVRR